MVLWVVLFLAVTASVVALVAARRFYSQMMLADEGTPLMREIAESVREGANAYLNQQNKIVAIVFVLVAIALAVASITLDVMDPMISIAFLTGGFFSGFAGWIGMRTATQASGRTAAAARESLNDGLQIAFRSGAVMGLTVVGLGLLYICIWLAILYGLIPGITGEAVNLSKLSVTMLSFGMGASAQALFARVGGGIFTKAADVGADLVGKVEESLAEDSPRNPATIADNVGDNVGDVAGMGADLYESYCGSILAASALGVAAMQQVSLAEGSPTVQDASLRAMMLPIAIAAIGIPFSLLGIYAVKTDEEVSQKSLMKSLHHGIHLATFLVCVTAVLATWWLMPSIPSATWFGFLPGVSLSVIIGLVSGLAIGNWTERVTSEEFPTTRNLAQQAESGTGPIIIGGIADGLMSVWVPVIVVCTAMMLSFFFSGGGSLNDPGAFALGLFGVGISAVGMLSTLGVTLATDAYGPIADNAGGNAEMAELEAVVRDRTDALDSLGNTTAATGKGFAIGSAALTALALLAAYVESVRDGMQRWGNEVAMAGDYEDGVHVIAPLLAVEVRDGNAETMLQFQPRRSSSDNDSAEDIPATNIPASNITAEVVSVPVSQATLQDFLLYYDVTLMNPRVLSGIFLGAMSACLFCAMTMKSVGRAAQGMVIEVRRQFQEDPSILTGETKPDYQRPVAISTKEAQREMILPSLVGLIVPIAVGLVLGVSGVLGLLTGCLTTGFCLAVFMANSGGAWDNAKKYIEAGHCGGKGSDAHKAAVVGDTVGDPFKDTSGPSLNILIKLMSMVSVVVAGLVVRYALTL